MQYRIRGDLIIIGVDAHLKVRHFPTDVRMVCHRDRPSLPDHQSREFTFQPRAQVYATDTCIKNSSLHFPLSVTCMMSFQAGFAVVVLPNLDSGIVLNSAITIISPSFSQEWQTDTPISSSPCSRSTLHSETSSLQRLFLISDCLLYSLNGLISGYRDKEDVRSIGFSPSIFTLFPRPQSSS